MSGQKIADRSFWAGGMSKNSVLAQGVKHKPESSADGVGSVGRYEDTTEAIKSQQEMGEKKAKARPMKENYRN